MTDHVLWSANFTKVFKLQNFGDFQTDERSSSCKVLDRGSNLYFFEFLVDDWSSLRNFGDLLTDEQRLNNLQSFSAGVQIWSSESS